MANPRFLLDNPLSGPGDYVLGREESHHAAQVMRVRTGDGIVVFDGKGRHAVAVVREVGKHLVKVRVEEVLEEAHLPRRLTLATAIPKGKRWQMLVEKCTELGVDRIIPMLTVHSVGRGEGNPDKWRRWIVEAAKQSRRAWLPEIVEPVQLRDIPGIARTGQAVLLVANMDGESPGFFREALSRAPEVVVMVGPEGGFSAEEAEFLLDQGAEEIRLSPYVLRVETAATTVCAIMRELML